MKITMTMLELDSLCKAMQQTGKQIILAQHDSRLKEELKRHKHDVTIDTLIIESNLSKPLDQQLDTARTKMLIKVMREAADPESKTSS